MPKTATRDKPLTSHKDMLEWQYKTLLAELSQVTLHSSDESCPCNQVDLEPQEFCLGKHLLNVSSLASETALMDDKRADMLQQLSSEAQKYHEKAKIIYCKGGEWPDLAGWSRDWRKRIEPIYYACSLKKAHARDSARLFEPPPAIAKQVQGLENLAGELTYACPERSDDRSYLGIIKELRRRTDALRQVSLPAVVTPARVPTIVTPAAVTNKTFATGTTGVTKYEFEYRIVDAGKLVVSSDPVTFAPNPKYPQELQPRLRERAANRLQVQNIAANLEPDALLLDYRSIDRGAPIVGSDMIVESGNGRVMALILAAKEHPQVYAKYKARLKEVAPNYALDPRDVDKLKVPILVRERLTKVDRRQFVEESNASTTIESSAIEKARSDAGKISQGMLTSLEVMEGEAIEDALRAGRNKDFVVAFLSKLPANEQARLVDARGILNQDGTRRIAMALFVATFRGDVGLRLAERFFESTDLSVRNTFNGIARSLGLLARAESLTANKERQPDYTIGEDLAKAVSVFSAIKKTPGMTVEKYVAQRALWERELTPFQERLLEVLNEYSRSAKRVGAILSTYAQLVIDSPPPTQVAMIETAKVSKEQLFETAIKRATEAIAEDVARMFEPKVRLFNPRTVTVPKEQLPFQWETVAIPPPLSVPTVPTSITVPATPKKYNLFPFQAEGYAWLRGRSFALLADEMGLGKTPQAIHWGADLRPVLVVVPAALVLNWQREIKTMWRPNDTTLVLDGKVEIPAKLPDWTIMSYGMLNHYLKKLVQRNFNAVIIDEAHLVKNMDTQRTKNILELVIPAEPEEGRESHRVIPNRLAVTGTPVLNRPIELFALLLFLGVKKRYDYRNFLETYTQHKYVKGRLVFTGARNLYQLNQELKAFMLRRLKKDVLKQLPPKVNTPLFVPISNAAEYRDAEINFLKWLRETAGDEAAMNAARAEIIVRMNSLRRLAAIGKVGPVCDWLKPCRDGQGKVLVFCSFTEPLENLRRCKPDSVLYTGALSAQERQSIVDEFQKQAVCYFMGTIGAAGVGITLTAANRVAFMDLPWTPGGKIQAEDRAHRIGQTKTVEIVNILAKGTIDERMLQLLADKELIIAQAIDGKTRDEAASTSVANTLIEQYIRAPALGEPIAYEPEMADPEPIEIDAEQLEIIEGLREPEVKLFDYSWLAKQINPCNLSLRDVDAALNWRPLRNIVAAAVGAKATVKLCSTGFVYGHYQLTIDNLTLNAEEKILNTVMKTTAIRQIYTAVSGQKVFEVVVPETKQEKELTWHPQEIFQPRGERGQQVAMFEDVFNVDVGVADIDKNRLESVAVTVDTGATLKLEAKEGKYARRPQEIIVYPSLENPDTIEWHYRPSVSMHKGSIRVVKPSPEILTYLGCPKSESWTPPSTCGRQAVVMTIVKLTPETRQQYLDRLQDDRDKGVKVRAGKRDMQTVPKVSEEVAEPVSQEVKEALAKAE